METEVRYSRQRATILDELAKNRIHPTAEEIYLLTRERIPNISLGTVYRNLKFLLDEGKIIGFTVDGKEHFDIDTKPHLHKFCKNCGSIEDEFFNSDLLNNLKKELDNFSVKNIIIEGFCKNCREN